MKLKLENYIIWVTVIAFLITVTQRFLYTMLSLNGVVGGLLGMMIGVIVGRVVAHERSARYAMILVTGAYGAGLVSGWINHVGEELFLFLLVALCLGLCFGCILGPVKEVEAST